MPPPPHPANPAVSEPTRRPPDGVLLAEARTDLVGRIAELARLDAAWDAAVAGGARLVLLSGEAGIGKTRLIAELARRVDRGGHTVLVGRCAAAGPPYRPISAALGTSAEVGRELADAPEAVLAEIGPLLEESDVAAGDGRSAPTGGERALYSAVAFLIGRLALGGPLLLIIDNAEHIDRASAVLLRHLVERQPAGLLIVVGYRDPPGGRHPPLLDLLGEMSTPHPTDRVVIGPMGEPDVADLVRDLLPSIDAGSARRLWQRTGGQPVLRPGGGAIPRRLRCRPGGTWLAGADQRPRCPPTPRPVVDRADPGRPPGRRRAGGRRRFRATDPGRASCPRTRWRWRSMRRSPPAYWSSPGRSWASSLRLPPPADARVVAADVAGLRLRRLHLRAARALQSRPQVRQSAVVATHLRAAGAAADPFEAAEWSRRAAREASELYAWDEAIEYADASSACSRTPHRPRGQAEAAVAAALLRLKSSRRLPEAVNLLETALPRYLAAGDDGCCGPGPQPSRRGLVPAPLRDGHSPRPGALRRPRNACCAPRSRCSTSTGAAVRRPCSDCVRHCWSSPPPTSEPSQPTRAGGISSWSRAGRRRGRAVNQGRLSEAEAIWERSWNTAHEPADPYLGWMPVNAAALVGNTYLWDPRAAREWCRRGPGTAPVRRLRSPPRRGGRSAQSGPGRPWAR